VKWTDKFDINSIDGCYLESNVGFYWLAHCDPNGVLPFRRIPIIPKSAQYE